MLTYERKGLLVLFRASFFCRIYELCTVQVQMASNYTRRL